MGQGTSQATAQSSIRFTSNADTLRSFNDRALKQFTVTELVSFKTRFGRDLGARITNQELTQWLNVPEDQVLLRELIYNFIQVLSNFPLLKDSYESVTGAGILKAIILTSPERCKKYVRSKSYDQLKLWFIALSLRKTVKEDPNMTSSSSSDETLDVNWILKSFNGLHLDDLSVPFDYMLLFISWLLLLTTHCPMNNCKLESPTMFLHWGSYEKSAQTILRSMKAYDESSSIEYGGFSHVIRSISPHIFDPLTRIMEHLLYTDDELVDPLSQEQDSSTSSKLPNPALIAQLRTALPRHLSIYHLQKLYMGRDDGFSMRSFQAKVFKWSAPTILLLRGKRISDDNEYNDRNSRYRKFLNEYPKLKTSDMDQELEEMYPAKSKVVLAVYISHPWKITNKEFFGGPHTTVVQLSPFQEILRSSQENLLYFNTIGGGIGIGNKQPVVRPTVKSYVPGNVSLTVDSALEFATLRHAGEGGTLKPGLVAADKVFEIKMLLQNVEVWGCGGEEELEEQLKQWQWEESEAKRRQQINLRSIGEDRALLEMAGLVNQSQSGGSV